jgi:uncharacterized protein YuzE
MRISYDAEVDAAYIHLTEEALTPGRDSVTIESPGFPGATIVLDWKDGKAVGLEVLDASVHLHADLLAESNRP